MCWNGPKWKRENVPDHKFDFVDVRDYHSTEFTIRMRYVWMYILVAKSFLVYVSDAFTAVTMLSTNGWTNAIYNKCTDASQCVIVDFNVGKWVFVGCILFGYALLVYEWWKAKKIIVSRDISYAFTNVMANNYYSLRSYDHFCFFCQIENSTKKKDDFAFFIFFTFKGWKRLILADGPRQAINALTLYSFWKVNGGGLPNPSKYFSGQSLITNALLVSITFTVLVFIGSLVLLIIAAVLYVPLLCYIQGNLKEYCCHKVDKRITELLKRKNRQRIAKEAALARKEAAGDFSHLRNKKGQLVQAPIPQPTLPDVKLDDEEEDIGRSATGYSSSQTQGTDDRYWDGGVDHKSSDYPPSVAPSADYPAMPAYDPYPSYGHHTHPHAGYSQSHIEVDDPSLYATPTADPTEYGSTAHLSAQTPYSSHDPQANQYVYDHHSNGGYAHEGYVQDGYAQEGYAHHGYAAEEEYDDRGRGQVPPNYDPRYDQQQQQQQQQQHYGAYQQQHYHGGGRDNGQVM